MLVKLGIFVGLPTVIAAIYFLLVASDMYVSHAVVMVQDVSEFDDKLANEESGKAAKGSAKEAEAIKEYILSRDMLEKLEDELALTQHYRQEEADGWSRLAASATMEESHAYFRKQVEVSFGRDPSILKLSVRAYSPEFAQLVGGAVLRLAEKKVNELSARGRADLIELATRESAGAKARLQAAHDLVKSMHEAHDREASAGDEPEKMTRRQELESALFEKSVADMRYRAATELLAKAELDAQRQRRYFVTVAAPSSPDEATEPSRILGILTVFLGAFSAFGIISLLLAAVREHARL